jgi:hypothetical protein
VPDAQTYSGSCHCGAVAYTVEVDPAQAMKCNCSICTRLGAVWAFAPKTKFKLTSGEAEQGDYQFNKKRLHHRFCTECGIESYAEGTGPDGSPTVGINLRCLEGVDVEKLSPRPYDGRSA